MADDDLWHVRIAPDEVKILSLEKLDDLFRLEVIDADVLVWQPGMDEWLPLRVVAGIGDDAPEVVNISVSDPPPRPVAAAPAASWPPQAAPRQATSAWPPQAVPMQTATSWPPQIGTGTLPLPTPPPRSAPPPRSVAPQVASRAPLGPVSHPPASLAPVSRGPTASSWPPPAAWDPPAAPAPAAAQFPLHANVTAQAAIDTDVRMRRRGGGMWLVAVALAAGAVVTLYRNAMVHAAARSMGQEGTYINLENALGGPSFGTPRAVEKMTESSRALAATLAVVPEAATPAAAPVATTPPAPTVTAAETSAPVPAKPEPAKAEAPSAPASKPAAASGPTRPVSATVRQSAASKTPDPVFKTPKKGKKGNEFDPLNGNL